MYLCEQWKNKKKNNQPLEKEQTSFVGISKPTKQNSKITKTAYPDEKKNNWPVHHHLSKNQNKNQLVQKKGEKEGKSGGSWDKEKKNH